MLTWACFNCFNKKSTGATNSGDAVKFEIMPNPEELHQLFENFKNEKYFHFLKTVFGVAIQMMCN